MSYSMHKIRSCAHTLRRDQGNGGLAGGELVTWKKFFKGWTVSFEGWNEAARWTEEEGRQAGEANAQVNIGIEAERRLWGLAALEAQRSEADGKAHQIKINKKKLGSGKPYDKRSEKEAAPNVPVVVGWRGRGVTDQD